MTAGTASLRHFPRGTAGPQSLAVGSKASLEKDRTGRHDVVRGPPSGYGLPR